MTGEAVAGHGLGEVTGLWLATHPTVGGELHPAPKRVPERYPDAAVAAINNVFRPQ